ncbi:MAG: MFS transporter [Armatimonas sp.]
MAPKHTGWLVLGIAALAMVGTLPGRTQGLGLITEPLLRDLELGRVEYAGLNLWATLLGGLFCIGIGQLQDKLGTRIVLTTLALALGAVVMIMGKIPSAALLFLLLVLVRGFGQSALSVVSLAMVGQWFQKTIERSMATYTIVMTMGFMIAFPLMESIIRTKGWRVAWSGFGWGLILVLAPLALLVPRPPRSSDLEKPDAPDTDDGATLITALSTPAFWVMGLASALYGLIASGIGLFNESVLKELGFSAKIYANTLAVTALTALIGNFLGGYLATKGKLNRLMAVAMILLMVGLLILPFAHSMALVMLSAVVMGIAGGFVMVLFFSVWAYAFGRAHLGKIQGAAQLLTVLASAVGPLALASVYERSSSYASIFFLLAGIVALFALLCALTPVKALHPASQRSPVTIDIPAERHMGAR